MVIYLSQSNFEEEPYIITKPGCYILTSDILFKSKQIYEYIISIQVEGVTLDLNGYTIKQEDNYAFYARYLSCISILAPKYQCDNYSDNISIKNGTLGRCSDYSIRVDESFKDYLYITQVVFTNYETGAIYAKSDTHKGKLKIEEINVNSNFINSRLSINYDFARRLCQTAKEIIKDIRLDPIDVATIATLLSNLETDLNYAAEKIINGDYTASYPWSGDNKLLNKFKSAIEVGRNLYITRSNIRNITVNSFTFSNVIDSLTLEVIVDSSASPLQSEVFTTEPNNVSVINWKNLINFLSKTTVKYGLNYPSVPTVLLNTLLQDGSGAPGYSYTTRYPYVVVSGIQSDNCSLKISRSNIASIVAPESVSVSSSHGNRIYIKESTSSNIEINNFNKVLIIKTSIDTDLNINNSNCILIRGTTSSHLNLSPLNSKTIIEGN